MDNTEHRYFLLHKPYNMVSQFISSHDVVLLGSIHFSFPEGTHAIGRLDNNSEGLLLLTTDKTVTRKLFNPKAAHTRKYLVKVRNLVSDETVKILRNGVSIEVKGGESFKTSPCGVEIVEDPYKYIQYDGNDYADEPVTWLMLTLTEGKFHQVRKMVQAVGHKCKRLVRVAIEDIELGSLKPGEVKEIGGDEFFRLLKIENY